MIEMKSVNSNWCTFLIIVTQFAAFIPFGINLTLLNASTPAIKVFINETYKQRYNVSASDSNMKLIAAMAQSALIIGSLIGVIFVSQLLSRLSRRSNITLIHLISIVSSVLMSVVAKCGQSYEALILGRFLSGISRGITFTVIPLYVAELVSRKTLAVYQAFSGCYLQVGSALGNAFAHPDVLGGVTTWPYLMITPAVFSIGYLFVIPFLPQTPAYLLTKVPNVKGTSDESHPAFSLMKKLRCVSIPTVKEEYAVLCEEMANHSSVQKATFREIFTTKKYRRQFFASLLILLSAQCAGLQAVLQYTNDIFKTAGVEAEMATFYTIGLFLLVALISLVSTSLLHRFGSKKMLLSGLSMTAVGLILLTVSALMQDPSMSYLGLIALVVYFIGAGVGPMLCLLALPAEITTESTRPIILWVAGIAFWIVATFVAFITPFALKSIGGYTYVTFLVLVSLEIIYLKFFIPNTKSKTVLEIQEQLQSKGWQKSKPAEEPFLTTTA